MTTKTFLADTAVGKTPMILRTPAEDKTGVLFVDFHGKGENGNGTLESLTKLSGNGNNANLLAFADKFGFSVLQPQVSTNLTNGNLWWSDPHIEAIIDYAIANHTKLSKVIVSGLSQGGGTVWEAITNEKAAPKIFGFLSICPTSQYGDNIVNKNDFNLIAKYGIAGWGFHAADDQTCPVANSRNMIASANRSNPDPKVKYTEYPTGGHYIWGRAYGTEEVYPYLLSFAPKAPTPTEPAPTPDEILSIHKITVYKSGKITTEKM